MKKIFSLFLLLITAVSFVSCTDSDDTLGDPKLIIKFKFDPTQVRLNNLGQPSTLAPGHGGQSPIFNGISSNYIEMAPLNTTPLGLGEILFHGAETTTGGDLAIDFSQAKIVGEDEVFLEVPLRAVNPGTYRWMRVSLSYQNYQISVREAGTDYTGTLASFVGYNTYINSFNIGSHVFDVNANKLQGYWAFALNDFDYATSGQAPVGATTVPNPLWNSSPIPDGSCVVTGNFFEPLVIEENEKKDIVVTLSLSTNKSFEWVDTNGNGKYEPSLGENVVDMGLRGLVPTYSR
ncbi:MAG: hypothetical protein JNJ52_06825 [Flavobacterium sp.]|nr:hypothetical protein [Flavobacterium sp.]